MFMILQTDNPFSFTVQFIALEVKIRAEGALEADLRHLENQLAALQASGVEAAGELDLFEMSR